MGSQQISYSEWKKRNEELRFRYNIETNKFSPQTWNCLPNCQSGCYQGCNNKCWFCYIIQDVHHVMNHP